MKKKCLGYGYINSSYAPLFIDFFNDIFRMFPLLISISRDFYLLMVFPLFISISRDPYLFMVTFGTIVICKSTIKIEIRGDQISSIKCLKFILELISLSDKFLAQISWLLLVEWFSIGSTRELKYDPGEWQEIHAVNKKKSKWSLVKKKLWKPLL
ncbi:hypothetical protein LOAG_05408 [Loa loa]|uniref:Uncharacterized protein n=1 Tax=Loa loa TaxID=7209 RepID=A0A1S0U0V1_LOALO|nr:hypothetical protein LOAG_05408 [Loa loa]EFO23079.1 hypothetical protein LOAG_05408 [Loa loa]